MLHSTAIFFRLLFLSLSVLFSVGGSALAGPTISWVEEDQAACEAANRCPTEARIQAAYDGATSYNTVATLAAGVAHWIDALPKNHTASYIVSLLNTAGEAYADPVCVNGAGLYPVFAQTGTNGSVLLFNAGMPIGLSYQLMVDGALVGTPVTDPSLLTYDTAPLAIGTHTFATNVCDQATYCALSNIVSYTKLPPPYTYQLVYKLDAGSGTVVADSSGNSYTGTTDAAWTPGVYGNGLTFSGTQKLVSGYSTLSAARSFAFWAKRTGPGANNYGRMFDKRTTGPESELFYNDEAAHVYRYSRNNGVWTIPQPSLNVWHHIAIVYPGFGAPTIYVDGVSQVLGTTGAATGVNSPDPYVFGNRGAGDRAWAGSLDDICIANEAWTATQVASIKANGC